MNKSGSLTLSFSNRSNGHCQMAARDFVRKMTLLFDRNRKITKFHRISFRYCCPTSILSFSIALAWTEFFSFSLVVSSRFKCNNERIIGHSFELNSMNKRIIELISLKWLGINRRFFHSISMWFVLSFYCFVVFFSLPFFQFAWFSVKYTVYLVFLRVSFWRIQQSLVTTHNRQSTYRMELNEHLAKKKTEQMEDIH